MISLNRKTDYALVAMAYLGQRYGNSEPTVSARQIAGQFGMPVPLLMNILKDLTRAGLTISTRGAQGGYELAIEPAQITLHAVVNAIEGPVRLARCVGEETSEPPACKIAGCCPIREPIHRLHDRLNQFLQEVTLADLISSKIDVPLQKVGSI